MKYLRARKKISIVAITTNAATSFGIDNEHVIFDKIRKNDMDYITGTGKDKFDDNFILFEYKGFYYRIRGNIEIDNLIDLAEKIFEKMENSSNEDNIRVEFKEEFIPDGYKINDFKKFGSSYDITVLDKSGKEINIVVIKNSAAISFGLDNEHTTYTNREINNKNYLMGYGVDKEFGNFVLVEHNGYYFDIHSYDVTEDQLIDLAEKIFEKMENSLQGFC